MTGTPPSPGPATARWTHVALPTSDLDAALQWYEEFTPLRVIHRREDADGQSAWLAHPEPSEQPFVLVLVMFYAHQGTPQPHLAPFAHLGIELPERALVDEAAQAGRSRGCLAWEPNDLPYPVGYVCALRDPDGNIVEFSHARGVYAAARELRNQQR